MKPDKYLIKQAAFLLFIMGGAGYGVWRSSQPKAVAKTFMEINFYENELLNNRQLVTINADSLETLFSPFVGQFFRYEKRRNFIFECIPGREKEFRQFFLNEKVDLSLIKHQAFKITLDPLRIELEMDQKGVFVTLPAEIVQSILINS